MWTIVVVALVVVVGSQWHGVAQEKATLEDRVAELEDAVAELQALAIRPATTIEIGEDGLFTDLSALNDPEQTYFSLCRQLPLASMVAPEAFDTLPGLQFNARTPSSTGENAFVALSCSLLE
jgi:hypothetical protein